MIGDALRYPVSDALGRTALLGCGAGVVAIAVGVRYAVAFAPSIVALVPALVALLGAVVLSGTGAVVLGRDEQRSPPSLRAVVRFGLGALGLSVVFLVPPLVLLAQSITQIPAEVTLEGGAGLFSLLSSTLLIFLFIACTYVYPAAVAAIVSTGRPRAAFEAETLRPALTDTTYFLRWAVGFSCAVLAGWFVLVSVRRGDVLGLLAAATAAYLLVAGSRAVGVGFARSSSGGSGPTPRSQ